MRNSFIVIVWLLIISLGVLGWLGQTKFGWWSGTQVAETPPATDGQAITTNRPANIQPSTTQPAETKTAETKATETKSAETANSSDTTAADTTKPAEAKDPATPAKTPTFDIVRVEPDGTAVIAGRAEPGSLVSVLVDGKTVVKEKANERGEWAAVVEKPIPPGNHNVTLSSDMAGKTVVSEQSVAIGLPDRKDEKPLIVLSKKGEPSKILQAPEKTPDAKPETQVAAQQPAPATSTPAEEPAEAAPAPAATTTTVAPAAAKPTGELALKTVDYDDQGNMIFTGTATPKESVRIYVNNRLIADAEADLSGVWTLRVVKEVEPGNHNLRVDQLTKDSKVASRIELPFTRVDPKRVIAALNQGKVPQVKQPSTTQDGVVEATESTAETASATSSAPSGAENSTANTTGSTTETAAESTSGENTSIVAQALSPSPASDGTAASEAAASPSAETSNNSVAVAPEQSDTQTQDTASATASVSTQTPAAGAETEKQIAAVIPPAGAGISSIESQTQTGSTTSGSNGEVVQRVGRVIIQPGNNLWNISRVIYGSGVSYTAIYQANKGQIRNPHLIYPGQIFTTPGVMPPEQIKP